MAVAVARYPLDRTSVLQGMDFKGFDFFHARKTQVQTYFERPQTGWSAEPTREIQVLMDSLGEPIFPALQQGEITAIYSYLLNPVNRDEMIAVLRGALERLPRDGVDRVRVDVERIVDFMATISPHFKQWKSQVDTAIKMMFYQFHNELRRLSSEDFEARLPVCMAGLASHIRFLVTNVRNNFGDNNNTQRIFDHIDQRFFYNQRARFNLFLCKKKFSSKAKNVMHHFASVCHTPLYNTPAFKKCLKAASREKDLFALEVRGAPENHFQDVEGLEAIHEKKQELGRKKRELQEEIDKHGNLKAEQNFLEQQREFYSGTDLAGDSQGNQRADLKELRALMYQIENDTEDLPVANGNPLTNEEKCKIFKITTGCNPSRDQAFEDFTYLDQVKVALRLTKLRFQKFKYDCERLEYEVQRLRLDFFKQDGSNAMFQARVDHYYAERVIPATRQDSSYFHYHYDPVKLLQYEVGKMTTLLFPEAADEDLAVIQEDIQKRFSTSEYANALRVSDKFNKQRVSSLDMPVRKNAKQQCRALLKTLPTRKFYLRGTPFFVKGLTDAVDLLIACKHLSGDAQYSEEMDFMRKELLNHVIRMKSDEYYATAMATIEDYHRVKLSILSQFDSDVKSLALEDQRDAEGNLMNKPASELVARLRKKAQTLKANADCTEDLAAQDIGELLESYAKAKRMALLRVKRVVLREKATLKNIYRRKVPKQITGDTVLSNLFGEHPDKLSQLDYVIENYRRRKRLLVDGEFYQAPSAYNNPSASTLSTLEPELMSQGTPMHRSNFQYYGELPIKHLARHFDPMITREEEECVTRQLIEELQQITYGYVSDETHFDYSQENGDSKFIYAHTHLPRSLEHVVKSQTPRERACMELSDELSRNSPRQYALQHFPILHTKIFPACPKFFHHFKPQVVRIEQNLNRLLIELRNTETRNRHKIQQLQNDVVRLTRQLTEQLVDKVIKSGYGIDVHARFLHQGVEELGYLVESIHAKHLFQANMRQDVRMEDIETVSGAIQTSIKKGLLDFLINNSVKDRRVSPRVSQLRFLLQPSNSQPLELRVREDFLPGFIGSYYQAFKSDTFGINPCHIFYDRLYSGDPGRCIEAALVKEVFHENQQKTYTAKGQTDYNCPASQGSLDFIRRSWQLCLDNLCFKRPQDPKTETLLPSGTNTSTLKEYYGVYAPLIAVVKHLKQAKPDETDQIEAELLRIKIDLVKRDFLLFEGLLRAEDDPRESAWKDEYALSIEIADKILSYKRLESDEIQKIVKRLEAKRTSMEETDPENIDRDWPIVLNQALVLVKALVNDGAIDEPTLNALKVLLPLPEDAADDGADGDV